MKKMTKISTQIALEIVQKNKPLTTGNYHYFSCLLEHHTDKTREKNR